MGLELVEGMKYMEDALFSLPQKDFLFGNSFCKFNVLMNSTRVANELGAGNPEGARSAVYVVLSVAVTEALIVCGTLLASRRLLGCAYSSEEEVISFVAMMVPLVCITVVTDGLQGVMSGYNFLSSENDCQHVLKLIFNH